MSHLIRIKRPLINANSQDADQLPLPAFRHIPGTTECADHKILVAVVSQALTTTTSATAEVNIAWRYGLRLLNLGYFWEAHEVLECVWKNAQPNSRERHLVQGVIQIANAALKHMLGRERASHRLLLLAAECFGRAFLSGEQKLMGLSAEALPSSENPAFSLPPQLNLHF